MTYKELAKQMSFMTDEQKECDISIVLLDSTEIIPVVDFITSWKEKDIETYTDHDWADGIDIVSGVLDENHPYLTIAY